MQITDAIARLRGWLDGSFGYIAYRGRAPDGVPQLRSDIEAVLAALSAVPKAEAVDEIQKLIREAKDQLLIAYRGGSYKSKINLAMHRLTAAERTLSTALVAAPQPAVPEGPILAALLRIAIQSFDSGGESMRSMRAQAVEAAWDILVNVDDPAFANAASECDADPWEFIASAKRLAATPKEGDRHG